MGLNYIAGRIRISLVLIERISGARIMSVRDNLERVRERVSLAAERAGRDPSGITIVAITKSHGPEAVADAVEAGIRDIGENRIQEFLRKAEAVKLDCRWHLVGHLQTNKVNKAVGRFVLIHSVDSVKLAEKLSTASEQRGLVTDVLLEVNTSGEGSKYGFQAEQVFEACERIAALSGVHVKGLMTVGPWVEDMSAVAASFAGLRHLGEEVARSGIEGVSMEHLSMGMTDDFEVAIEEGSTIVRLGRVLFGERSQGRGQGT
jgi:pyridoxal phosphate enzyme (YggS family)